MSTIDEIMKGRKFQGILFGCHNEIVRQFKIQQRAKRLNKYNYKFK